MKGGTTATGGDYEVEGQSVEWQQRIERIVTEMGSDINNFKEDYRGDKKNQEKINEKVDTRLGAVETTSLVNTKDIANIQQALGDIKDDTKWLRRTITGAIITSFVGGFIGLVFLLAQ